jgi:hypothetical protein
MGSRSDWPILRHAAEMLDALGVAYEAKVVSAHRTPERMYDFAKGAKAAAFKVIIAGPAGAAHLPGMTASLTELPVLGVPIETKALKGMDSLLSIVQMPAASRWARWRSARRAPRTPACWPPRSWRCPTRRGRRGSPPSRRARPRASRNRRGR